VADVIVASKSLASRRLRLILAKNRSTTQRRGRTESCWGIGVWLTSSGLALGHGLDGSAVDKTRYRLRIEVPVSVAAQARYGIVANPDRYVQAPHGALGFEQ
jgi:hypothetical protein